MHLQRETRFNTRVLLKVYYKFYKLNCNQSLISIVAMLRTFGKKEFKIKKNLILYALLYKKNRLFI